MKEAEIEVWLEAKSKCGVVAGPIRKQKWELQCDTTLPLPRCVFFDIHHQLTHSLTDFICKIAFHSTVYHTPESSSIQHAIASSNRAAAPSQPCCETAESAARASHMSHKMPMWDGYRLENVSHLQYPTISLSTLSFFSSHSMCRPPTSTSRVSLDCRNAVSATLRDVYFNVNTSTFEAFSSGLSQL